jgi:predicted nucleic acid-binding protein
VRAIDTKVLVYHLTGQNGDLSKRSSELFLRLASGTESAYFPVTAIFECTYVCQSTFRVPNDVPARLLLYIVTFPGVVTDQTDALKNALELWRIQGPLSFADCYHLAQTKELGMTEIYTFDRKMDRFPGVTRIEP